MNSCQDKLERKAPAVLIIIIGINIQILEVGREPTGAHPDPACFLRHSGDGAGFDLYSEFTPADQRCHIYYGILGLAGDACRYDRHNAGSGQKGQGA